MSWLASLVRKVADKARPPAAHTVEAQATAAAAAALNPNRKRAGAPRVPGAGTNSLAAGTDPLGSSSTARGDGSRTWLPLMNSRRPGA